MKIGSKDSCVINFENKGFDNMHISSVFRSQNVVLKLPEPLQTDGNNPVLAMKLEGLFKIKYWTTEIMLTLYLFWLFTFSVFYK